MIWNREQYEERQYPTQGRYLRGHKAAFEQAGYPVNVQSAGPGMYILIVSLPTSMPQELDPYDLPRRRRRHVDWRRIVVTICVLVMACSMAYMAYSMFFGGAPAQATAAATPEPSLWDHIVDALPHGEPTVEPVQPKAIEMPWDAAGRQVSDTIDSIGRILTIGVTVLLLIGAAFVFIRIRDRMGK